jgi:Rrf2 family transcriptional regulator, nitric oxide-sensitive transcriptional repressor
VRLTTYSDYGLRILIYLGLRPKRTCTVREIAVAYGISENHLLKIVQTLARAGFVETVRGPGGGVRLARAPADVVVGDVVRATETDLALVECFPGGAGGCAIAGACRLQGVLDEALDAFLAVLDRHTLADLLARPGALRRRFVGAHDSESN